MALSMNSTSNFNGASVIENNTIATFNASYNGDGRLYINKTIESVEKYVLNKEVVDADGAQFEEAVISKITE